MVTGAGVLLVLLAGSVAGQAGPLARFEFAETHMGSEFRIVLYSPDVESARRASRAAFERIAALDAALSDYQPESELMRLCDRAGGPPVTVGADLFAILQRSKAMYEKSGGAFDVTVGPVVRLWRRARRDRKLPAAEALARARSLVSSDLLTLDPSARTVRLARPGMKLDLGGIAKGYASDEAVKVLTRLGFPRCLVAGAGDIVAGDSPPGRDGWTVDVAPLDPSIPPPGESLTLTLRNAAVSTSGDSARFVEIGGTRYSHIVDPRTGVGVVDRCSVTVVAPDGATADALDTAVYVLGPALGLPLVESTPGASALIVRQTSGVVHTYHSRHIRDLLRPRAVPFRPSRNAHHSLYPFDVPDDPGWASHQDSGMESQISLMELLEGLHDPRRAQGRRHPLPALLGLAVVAMLPGMTSDEAIVRYGKERGWEFLQHVGFTTRWGLCKATYSRVFRRIDVADFEARVGRWLRGQLGPGDVPQIAIDGKTARGSRDGDTPGVHLVAAYAPHVKAVLAQLRVDAKTNEHKAALELLGVLKVKGKVVTGDAMFTHRDFCAKVIARGGDYILPVKDNQPTLGRDITAAFAESLAGPSPPPDRAAGGRDRTGL